MAHRKLYMVSLDALNSVLILRLINVSVKDTILLLHSKMMVIKLSVSRI